MTYSITDHGVWRPYTPDPMPDWVAEMHNVGGIIIFLKRESDGADFYEYRNKTGRFAENAVTATVLLNPATDIETVKSVFRGHDMVFPLNQRLIEIVGVGDDVEKVHKLFEWKTYHPDTVSLSDPAPAPVYSVTAAQAKTALFNMKRPDGKTQLDYLEEVMAEHDYRPMKIFFDGAIVWQKADSYVQSIALELGLVTYDAEGNAKDADLDAFFIAASKL